MISWWSRPVGKRREGRGVRTSPGPRAPPSKGLRPGGDECRDPGREPGVPGERHGPPGRCEVCSCVCGT